MRSNGNGAKNLEDARKLSANMTSWDTILGHWGEKTPSNVTHRGEPVVQWKKGVANFVSDNSPPPSAKQTMANM